MILNLPILVLNLEAILCRSDFRIGLVAVLVSRRALDAFSCFDREIRGVTLIILIRYAELIRINATRGDVVARDVGIRRSPRFLAVCGRAILRKGRALCLFRGHGGVTCGVGDLAIFDLAIRCCTHGIGDAGRSGHAGIRSASRSLRW